MLVKNPMKIEDRCPRRWSLLAAAGLLSLAIVGAGVGLRAVAAPAPSDENKKEELKKDKETPKKDAQDRKERPRLPEGFPDIDDLMKRLPQNLPEDQAKMLREHMERVRKMMEQMHKQMPDGAFPPLPGAIPQLPQLPQIPEVPQLPGLPNAAWGAFIRPGHPLRLGVHLDKPSAALVDQLDLPRGQGLVIESVLDNSAAAKAGLKKHDILLEFAGKPVPNDVSEFARMVKDVKPDTKVDVVVLRKTRKETVKGLTLPKPKEAARPGNFNVPNVPRFGGGFGNSGLGGTTTITRTNDAFTARNQQGDVVLEVKGKVEDGKAKVDEVKVKDGDKAKTYDSVDKVPEQHRDQVQKLIDAAAGRGVRGFQFRTPQREEN